MKQDDIMKCYEKYKIPTNYVIVDGIKEIQSLLYKLFYKFHAICNKNKLVYNAFGGTLLGAVRHQGMIPWDDDIDVCMPRKDYNKLLDLILNNKYPQFELFAYPKEGYIYPFAKFCMKDTVLIENTKPPYARLKLFIDVFPIDGYPTQHEEEYFRKFTKLKKGLCQCVYPLNPSVNLIKRMAFPFLLVNNWTYLRKGYKHYLEKQVELAQTYSYDNSDYVLCMGAGWKKKGKMLKSTFEDRRLYRFGEGYAWGINNYDEHLTMLYGDYMMLPPADKRKSNHNYILFVSPEIIKEEHKYEQ